MPNCLFEKVDCEDPWLYTETFDYVHMRFITTGIRDPPGLIREAFRNLEPGGWLEMQDCHMEYVGADPDTQGTALQRFSDYISVGAAAKGYDLRKAKYYKQWLIEAGCKSRRKTSEGSRAD